LIGLLTINSFKQFIMRGIIVFKGKYGATAQYAQWLASELQLPAIQADQVSEDELRMFDVVIVAGSVYIGKWLMRDWVKQYLNVLRAKKVFFLIVCGTPASAKNEQIKIANDNTPADLSNQAETFFLPGRLVIRELSWLDRFMLKMGARMQKDPVIRERMLQDVDNIRKENLVEIIRKIKSSNSCDIPRAAPRQQVISRN